MEMRSVRILPINVLIRSPVRPLSNCAENTVVKALLWTGQVKMVVTNYVTAELIYHVTKKSWLLKEPQICFPDNLYANMIQ